MRTIKFDRPTKFDFRGRNGYAPCYGVEIVNVGTGDYAEIHLFPVGMRGKPSEACRLPIRKSAIPEIIEALVNMVGPPTAPSWSARPSAGDRRCRLPFDPPLRPRGLWEDDAGLRGVQRPWTGRLYGAHAR